MTALERFIQTLSRWAPTILAAAMAAVLFALHRPIAAGGALGAAALFAVVALIDSTNLRS